MYKKESLLNYSFLSLYTKYLTDDAMIAGGCFKNLMGKEKPKDIDIFFKNKKALEKAINLYSLNFKKIYENDNAICFKDEKEDLNIELIKSIFGKPIDILNEFDFSIVKMGLKRIYHSANSPLEEFELIYHKDFFEHLFFKRLVLNEKKSLSYPIGTFNRSFRYCKYGYNLCQKSKIYLLKEIQKLNPDDIVENVNLYDGFD